MTAAFAGSAKNMVWMVWMVWLTSGLKEGCMTPLASLSIVKDRTQQVSVIGPRPYVRNGRRRATVALPYLEILSLVMSRPIAAKASDRAVPLAALK